MGKPHYQMVNYWIYFWLPVVVYLLSGCSTAPVAPLIKVVDNPEREKYITRIEHETSEASAALKVAKDGVSPLYSKLVDLTIVRLDGIKLPTSKQVEAFRATLGNTSELKKAEDKAGRVNEETSMLYDLVEERDMENMSLKAENEAIRKEQAFAELRAKCFTLGSWFTIGGGLLLVGASVLGLPRFGGAIMLLIAVLCFASPFVIQDVVNALWFKIVVGAVIVLSVIAFLIEAYGHHSHVKGRLTPQNKQAT